MKILANLDNGKMTRHEAELPEVEVLAEHVASDRIAVVVYTEAHVAVDAVNHALQFGKTLQGNTSGQHNGTMPVGLTDPVDHVAQGAVGRIVTGRLDDRAHELDTLLRLLQIDLVGVQREMQPILQPLLDLAVYLHDTGLVTGYDAEVIDEADIGTADLLAALQDDVVHEGQVEVGEELRRKVADGHAHTMRVEQALALGQLLPQCRVAPLDTIALRIVTDNLLREVNQRVDVAALVILADERDEQRQQHVAVDGHEERTEVELAYPCLYGVVLADAHEVILQPVDSRQCAVALAAVVGHIALLVETHLEQRFQTEAHPMVHDAVTEIRCKDLTKLREGHDEAGACGRFVGTALHLKSQLEKVIFKM